MFVLISKHVLKSNKECIQKWLWYKNNKVKIENKIIEFFRK